MQSELLVLGLNPAWQRLFLLERLVPGSVHRLPAPIEYSSGKGVNFCRVLARLGYGSTLAHFLGGQNGKRIQEDLHALGQSSLDVSIQAETRVCHTLSDSAGLSTELIEPSPRISQSENDAFFDALHKVWKDMRRVVVCGTFPEGFNEARLNTLDLDGKRLYVDAWRGVEGWLTQGAALLKINRTEVGQLLGVPEPTPDAIPDLVSALMNKWSIATVVVTDGPHACHAFRKPFATAAPIALRAQPPMPQRFVNAIGAGDSFMAGWVYAEIMGGDMASCLTTALSVATARCEARLPWELDLQRLGQLERLVANTITDLTWKG